MTVADGRDNHHPICHIFHRTAALIGPPWLRAHQGTTARNGNFSSVPLSENPRPTCMLLAYFLKSVDYREWALQVFELNKLL
jgi:hypothetical protein